ncbi:MAG: hypothetical protein JXB62_06765 [Pirellulales bacterium]|nr:hypothetical protein [Pirellulales bacterium]
MKRATNKSTPRLPELTPLQFLVLTLLFSGPRSGRVLRDRLGVWEAARTPTAFSNLMRRMVALAYVEPDYDTAIVNGHTVRQCIFRATDLGVMAWNATRQFYLGFEPPPAGLEVAITDEARYFGHAPRQRKQLVQKAYTRRLVRMFTDRRVLRGLAARHDE